MFKDDSKNNNEPQILTIKKIQELVSEGKIELPPIQRGFVWKPYQIENLWDSLLRGFPIGCFICKKNSNDVIEILDGQQRLTSILLGLNWDKNSLQESSYARRIRKMQDEEIKIFVEKDNSDKNDPRIYNTRVITKYHPWGYQRNPNDKILSYDDIRAAKQLIKNERTASYDVHLTSDEMKDLFAKGFPYDVCNTVDRKNACIPLANMVGSMELLSTPLIPFLFINENTVSSKVDKELDATEYLFTLINRGGTRVSNDDLNFSLVKSKLMEKDDRDTIESINKACENIGISPARFVMICYFLWNYQSDIDKSSISLYINPKVFRKTMENNVKRQEFINFLKEQFNFQSQTIPLLINAKNLMVCSIINKNGIPYVWFLDILQQNMYLTFLIYYILKQKNENNLQNVDEYLVPIITTICIFGYQKRQHQTQKKLVEGFIETLFNNKDLCSVAKKFFQQEKYLDLMRKPLKPNDIKWENDKFFDEDFGYYMKWRNALLLYAQREFLAKEFISEQFTLDDMNRPFDYDHIFPAKYYERGTCKNWNTIGNFRAWPYYLNRSDHEETPYMKFREQNNKEKYDTTLFDNSFCYEKKKEEDQKDYSYFIESFNSIGNKETLKTNEQAKIKAEKVIRKRMFLIYKEWYDKNKIEEIFYAKDAT